MGELDLSLGALLIGVFVNTLLYGIVLYQFARYHVIEFNDPLWMRMFVLFLFLLDTVYSASNVYMAYHFCVTNFGKLEALAYNLWPYPLTSFSCSIISFMTHVFLIGRIHALTHNNYVCGILAFCAFACFSVGFSAGIQSWIMPTFAEMATLIPQVTAWFALSFSLDLIIASILIWILQNKRTGVRRTDTLLTRLMGASVRTGVFAAVFNMGALLSFRFAQSTNISAVFGFPIGRVYTNTLMASLIDRAELKNIMEAPLSLSLSKTNLKFRLPPPSSNVEGSQRDDIPMQENHSRNESFTERKQRLERYDC